MNMTLDELKARAKQDLDNAFEKGKSQGGGGNDVATYMVVRDNQWAAVAFPEGYDFVLSLKTTPQTFNNVLVNATGVKTATIICETEAAIVWTGLVRNCTVEVLDLTKCKLSPKDISYFALNNAKIVSVLGVIDMSNCTAATLAFSSATALEDISFKESTIGISIAFNNCLLLSAESLHSIMMGLSPTVTGQTLTLPKYATCKATYDAVYGDGAWDILAASKTNWTIAYS